MKFSNFIRFSTLCCLFVIGITNNISYAIQALSNHDNFLNNQPPLLNGCYNRTFVNFDANLLNIFNDIFYDISDVFRHDIAIKCNDEHLYIRWYISRQYPYNITGRYYNTDTPMSYKETGECYIDDKTVNNVKGQLYKELWQIKNKRKENKINKRPLNGRDVIENIQEKVHELFGNDFFINFDIEVINDDQQLKEYSIVNRIRYSEYKKTLEKNSKMYLECDKTLKSIRTLSEIVYKYDFAPDENKNNSLKEKIKNIYIDDNLIIVTNGKVAYCYSLKKDKMNKLLCYVAFGTKISPEDKKYQVNFGTKISPEDKKYQVNFGTKISPENKKYQENVAFSTEISSEAKRDPVNIEYNKSYKGHKNPGTKISSAPQQKSLTLEEKFNELITYICKRIEIERKVIKEIFGISAEIYY